MLQADHHIPCAQGSQGNLPKWLPPRGTHVSSHEVLWKAGHGSHQQHPPGHPRPTPIRIPPKQIHRWLNQNVRKLSETPVTQVIDCFLCYGRASGTGAPNLGPKGATTASTPKPLYWLTFQKNRHRTICTLLLLAVCLLPMHSHFAPTYMYRFPQLACTPAHWLSTGVPCI